MLEAHEPPAGGAPASQVALTALIMLGFLIPVVLLATAERTGRTTPLGRAADRVATRTGLPRWVALPSLMLLGSLLSAGLGVYWDVPYHVDLGRDDGPLANPSHYFILFGLLGVLAAGLASCGLASGPLPRRTLALRPGWRVPLGAAIITVAGGFALLGFPLDDLWHRIFGQDVTEWGPTHVLMLGGAVLSVLGCGVLAAEARQVGASGRWVRALEFRCAVWWLFGIAAFLLEYDLGVPQFPLLAQVVIVGIAGTWALTWARAAYGPGGALLAATLFLVGRALLALVVGEVLGRTSHRFSLFLASAVLVEIAALFAPVARRYRFGVLAGVLVGTLGTATEWAWTQMFLPLPWPASQLPLHLGYGLVAGVGAGLLAGWQLSRLDAVASPDPEPRVAYHPRYGLLASGAVLAVGILAVSVPRVAGGPLQGRLVLDPVAGGRAFVTVRLDQPDAAEGAVWFTALSWQGGGAVRTPMERVADGVWRSARPLPVSGEWKTLVRLHTSTNRLVSLPVYLPGDPAVPVAEIPARSGVTRPFQAELHLLQREARTGLPAALWYAGYGALLLLYLALLGMVTALHARAAAPAAPPTPAPSRRVVTPDGVDLAVDVSGPPDATVAVVLLHGWCLSSEIFFRLRAGLAGQPIRVVTYDARGHGRSGAAPRGSTTIAQVAQDLRTVIDAVCGDLPVVLAGHSLGGMTIMALAETDPDLFTRRIAGVLFVNTAAGDLDAAAFGLPDGLARVLRGALTREFARRHRRHLRRGDAAPVRRRIVDALMARAILFGPGAAGDDVALGRRLIATAHPGVVEGFFADLLRHDRHHVLRALAHVPVRVLAGGRDRLTPLAHSRRIADALPGARLLVFPGAGHMLPLERPEEVTAEILRLARDVGAATRIADTPRGGPRRLSAIRGDESV